MTIRHTKLLDISTRVTIKLQCSGLWCHVVCYNKAHGITFQKTVTFTEHNRHSYHTETEVPDRRLQTLENEYLQK